MSTTFYSGEWKSGNSIDGFIYLRARCDYTVTTTNPSVTVSGTLYLQHKGVKHTSTMDTNNFYALADTPLTSMVKTDPIVEVAAHSSWTSIKTKTFSFTINRDTSNRNVDFKISVSTSGYAHGANYQSTALTIPILPSYTITYDANGGNEGGMYGTTTKYYGKPVQLKYSSGVVHYYGYKFWHWNTASDNSGTSYSEGSSYPSANNANVTLYAIWNPEITYDGKYSDATDVPYSQTKTYGQSITLRTGVPKRQNYVFWHWNTKGDNTGTTYNPGDTIAANVNTPLALIAIWGYVLEFDANGGTNAPASVTKYYGVDLTLPTSTPTRTGYSFAYWDNRAQHNPQFSRTYLPGDTFSYDTVYQRLYAQWTANVYTVSFNSNGGINAPAPMSKIYDKSATLPQTAPTRVGHTFLGWASTSNAVTPQWVAGGSYSENILANTTLYAVWRDDYTSPVITSIDAFRCDAQGVEDDTGTYAMVTAVWSIDTSVDEGVTNSAVVSGLAVPERGSSFSFTFDSGSTGQSGTAVALVPNMDPDTQYTVKVTVTDVRGASAATTRSALVLRTFYIMDFGSDGDAVGIGRAAPLTGLEVGYAAMFDDDVTLLEDLSVDGDVSVGGNVSSSAEVSATDSNDVVHNLTEKADQSDVDTDLAGKVNKSGDTMTGDLVNAKPASPIFVAKDEADLSETDNGITAAHYPGFRTNDALGRIVSSFESQIKTDGTTSSYMYVRNYADDSSSYVGQKGLKIQLDKSGTATWTVDEPASFRSAINAVNKSGDTITGSLTANAVYYHAKSGNIDRDGTYPSSATYGTSRYSLLDKDSETIGQVRAGQTSDNRTFVQIGAINENTDSSGDVGNWLTLYAKRDGTYTYGVSNAANFCSAIGAVSKAGDTITGGILNAKSSNLDRDGSNPSSNTSGNSYLRFQDTSGETIGSVFPHRLTDGEERTYLQATNEKSDGTGVSNSLTVGVKKDGTLTYMVSSPANFRSAIGLGSDLGWTVGKTSYAWYMKRGRFCIVSAGSWGGVSAASGSYTNLFTLPSGYRPVTKPSGSHENGTVYGMCNSNGSDVFTYYNITDAGVVRVGSGGSATKYWSFMCVFPVA